MSDSLKEKAQQLAITIDTTNKIVSAINVNNTLKTGFQNAAAKWRERITELETEVSTLRKEVQETKAIIAPLEAKHTAVLTRLEELFGEDGKGGQEMMAMIAEWLNIASNAPTTTAHPRNTNSSRTETPINRNPSVVGSSAKSIDSSRGRGHQGSR